MALNIFHRNSEEIDAPPKHILVPVKGAPEDEEAMRYASTYALTKMNRGRNVVVDVVYVVEVPHALPLNAELAEEVHKGETALDRAETAARELGLNVEVSIIQARSAGAAVVDLASENATHLIVMAARYAKKLGELDLGRTIPYVLKNAPCRVWVIRTPMNEA